MTGNEIVDSFRTSLTRFHDEAAAFMQSQGHDPVAGSVAATERTSYARPESPLTVAAIGILLIESVGEHVTAYVKTITEPVEPLACWTCVRSMLESAAIAAWMFDPKINVQERVRRSFAHRYEGMDQQLKLMRVVGQSAQDIQKLEDHIKDTESIAIGLGFPKLRNKDHKRTGIGQVMPSATNMIQIMLDEERSYRLLSAVAHGHIWAIQQLGFTPGVAHLSASGTPTVTELHKHSGILQGYMLLTYLAAKSFALPLWNHCLYFGWDKDRLKTILESAYDGIQATDKARFWR